MSQQQPTKDINLNELRHEMTWHLAIFVISGSAIAFWFELWRSRHPTVALIPWVLLILVGIGVYILNFLSSMAARHLLMAALGSALIAEMYLFPDIWIPFLAVPLAFVGALLISRYQWFITTGVGIVAWWYAHLGSRDYPLPELLMTLVAGAVLTWLAVQSLYTALEWAWTSQCRAVELLERSRDHQGELNRALKSLEQAYALQTRTQRELHFARKQAEEARRMKERFAANISHELRTPLNLILGFSELMYLSQDVYGSMRWPPGLRRDIHHVYRSSRHLLEMIDDILDLSRADFGEFTLNKEMTPLEPLLRNAAEMIGDLFQTKAVELRVELHEPLPVLEIDRTRIRQVLLNLLNNAQRFTDSGHVALAATQNNKEVIISVSDTGPGIPPDKVSHIFDEFYQADHSIRRQHQGAGLGLAISKRFVEAHQGRIWVRSREGEGSTFCFSLPLADRQSYASQTVERQWEAERYPILVVESDPRVGALIERHLESCEVIRVRELDQMPDEVLAHHPRAVVVNVLPGTQSHAAALLPLPVPVIECSLPSFSWMARGLRVMSCLTKPILAKDLLAEVELAGEIKSVLIVDDDRGFCHLIERMLHTRQQNIAVQTAYSGEDGLAALRGDPPDLLILDLLMPDIDGFQVLAAMRRDPALCDIPVILLTATGYAEELLMQRDSQLNVRRSGGLYPSEVLRCLRALIGVLEPKHDLEAIAAG